MVSLVFVSIIMWIVSVQQFDTMMSTMLMFYNPTSLSLFTVIWTAGMAAMMFPAISPMVLLYDRLIKTNNNTSNSNVKTTSLKKRAGKAPSLVFDKDNKEVQEGKKRALNQRDACRQLMQRSVSCDTAPRRSWLPWVESLSKKSWCS